MRKVLVIVGSRREGNSLLFGKKVVSMLKKMRVPVSYIVPGNQKFIYVQDAWIVIKKESVILKMI